MRSTLVEAEPKRSLATLLKPGAWRAQASALLLELAWNRALELVALSGPSESLIGSAPQRLLGSPVPELFSVDARAGVESAAAEALAEPTFLCAPLCSGKSALLLGFPGERDEASGLLLLPPSGRVHSFEAALFASNAAHEVRNPLSSVKMAVQTVARTAQLDPRGSRRLALALREIRTMERLLDALGAIARPDAWAHDRGDLGLVLLQAIGLAAPDLSERGVGVDFFIAQDLPPVPLDARQLSQALSQLLVQLGLSAPDARTLLARASRERAGVALSLETGPASTENSTFLESSLALSLAQKVAREHRAQLVLAQPPKGGFRLTLLFPEK